MSRGLLPAAAFAFLAGQMVYGLLVDGDVPTPFHVPLAVGALLAYARRNVLTVSRAQTWTIAGLSLLAMAAVVIDESRYPDAEDWTETSAWMTGRLLETAGVLALAAALLIRTGLPRNRRLIPAFALAFGSLLVVVWFAGHSLSDGEAWTRTWLVTLIAVGVVAAGFAANAALTGARRMLAAGLGLLPVIALLTGALFGAGDTDLFDRPLTSAEQAQRDAVFQSFAVNVELSRERLRVPPAVPAYELETTTTTATTYIVVDAAPALSWGDPKAALEAAVLLAGLLAFVVTMFPPTGGIALYSYRSDG